MIITAIKQQAQRKDRYSIFVDGAYAFSLSESGLIESRLASGQELSTAELKALRKAAGIDRAYSNGLRYVALRPRSEWEMREYFRRKGVDVSVAQHIIDRLRAVGLIDDLAFARAWIAHRRLLKSTSLRRLRLELQQKQVPSAIVDQVLAEDTTDDQQALRRLIAKKQARYPDAQKFMQYLARQGFSYDAIKTALSSADSDN